MHKNRLFLVVLLISLSNTCLAKEAKFANNTVPQKTVISKKPQIALKDYTQFIQSFCDSVIKIMQFKPDNKTPESTIFQIKNEKFKILITKIFHIKHIARHAVARYWRIMNAQEQDEYLQLFTDVMVDNYVRRFNEYNDEKLQIKSTRKGKRGAVLVTSAIVNANKEELAKIRWEVFHTKSGFMITDVAINGVSMLISLRNEYKGILSDKSRSLVGYLKKKLEKSAPKDVL